MIRQFMMFDAPINRLEAIAESTLRELCVARALHECRVVGLREGGLILRVVYGSTEHPSSKVLGTSRGGLRRFASLDTAAAFLRELEVNSFAVDLTDYEPGLLRPPRPDRSAAMKKTRTIPKQAPLLP